MKLCSYQTADGAVSYGVLTDEGLRDAGNTFRARFADLRAVLAANALEEMAAACAASQAVDADAVTLLPPIPRPDKIICIGLNYMSHIIETGREKGAHPPVFTRYPDAVIGHQGTLLRPRVSERFDYEGELAVVIGKPARHVAPQHAMDHVAGYSCFNDGSIRDYQGHTSQFWPGKNFDASGSMGPCLVTPDEAGRWEDMTLETRLNGKQVQHTAVSDLAFSVPDIIAYLSTVITLLPGDVIATGTPSGVAAFRKPPLWMKAGDVVEVEISGVGVLRNPVADED